MNKIRIKQKTEEEEKMSTKRVENANKISDKISDKIVEGICLDITKRISNLTIYIDFEKPREVQKNSFRHVVYTMIDVKLIGSIINCLLKRVKDNDEFNDQSLTVIKDTIKDVWKDTTGEEF